MGEERQLSSPFFFLPVEDHLSMKRK